jgi:hypothetical protein
MSDEKPPGAGAKPAAARVRIPGTLQVTVDDEVANGMYSNFQVVGSNETEFVVDFAYVQPQQPVGKVRARVILSPKHAKSLLQILGERVADHEQRFGKIELPVRVVRGPEDGGSGMPN